MLVACKAYPCMSRETLDRIILCVNACQDIPSKDIQSGMARMGYPHSNTELD